MAILQPLIDLVALCAEHGISHAVISPGSRSAALTLAFARHKKISTTVVMDERAAGFIAMGIAQQLNMPVALVCTSGSAAYNFAPAVVEAYFQQIPLLVLTADRPREWIHQQDGQTIFQSDLYGKNCKRAFDLPSNYHGKDVVWYINRMVNEAIAIAMRAPAGPVHINVPIEEPFYPADGEEFKASTKLRKISVPKVSGSLEENEWQGLRKEWNESRRILLAAGQMRYNATLSAVLGRIAERARVSVMSDSTGNLQGGPGFITKQDLILGKKGQDLSPDLLVTFGKSFISKNFKEFIRNTPSVKHWHIGEEDYLIDTFQSLTRQIAVSPICFFSELLEYVDDQDVVAEEVMFERIQYRTSWQIVERKSEVLLREYMDKVEMLNELTLFSCVLDNLPAGCQLHVANSMAIRYVNLLGGRQDIEIFANRGTSGIDGCVSTAVGAALVSKKLTYLLVGDVAFLYDRNGLLISPFPDNLRIVVFNNQGGTIFRMIDGPARQPELERYFETRHSYTAERTAADSGLLYLRIDHRNDVERSMKLIRESQTAVVVEFLTDPEVNASVFQGLKRYMNENL